MLIWKWLKINKKNFLKLEKLNFVLNYLLIKFWKLKSISESWCDMSIRNLFKMFIHTCSSISFVKKIITETEKILSLLKYELFNRFLNKFICIFKVVSSWILFLITTVKISIFSVIFYVLSDRFEFNFWKNRKYCGLIFSKKLIIQRQWIHTNEINRKFSPFGFFLNQFLITNLIKTALKFQIKFKSYQGNLFRLYFPLLPRTLLFRTISSIYKRCLFEKN